VDVGDDVVVDQVLHNDEIMPRYIRSCNSVFYTLYDYSVMNQFERLFAVSGLSLDRLRSFLRVVEAGNLSKAAMGDPIKQSQYSRQIKEMESFFGVALTRRIGRRIEITEEGKRLALLIRRQFSELDDFREAMSGRCVSVRIGSQGSIIDWLIMPRLGELPKVLGHVTLELEQMRTLDVVRAVDDGRLDFGIVRDDALKPERKCWKLGKVGYSLFAATHLWKGCRTAEDLIKKAPMIDLLPGGQFSTNWQQWLTIRGLHSQVIARASSFTDLVKAVQAGHAAAVLPNIAAVDFDLKKHKSESIPALKHRTMVLIANHRSLDRAGLPSNAAEKMANFFENRINSIVLLPFTKSTHNTTGS